MSGRWKKGGFSQKTQPPPTWSGMWQSWQECIGPVLAPPKRLSGKETPVVANSLLAHSE